LVAAAAAYAGASILFGAFMVGLIFSYVSSGSGRSSLDFRRALQGALGILQAYLLLPLFFTSIGFSIPFHDLWKRSIVWKGIVCSIVMMLGKMVVGIWVPIWTLFRRRREGVAQPTGDTGGDAIIGGKVEA
jgi:Kef-type K+ transport system membrane component KefB